MNAEPRRVQVTLESRIESVDLGEELALGMAGAAGLDEDEQYKLSMAVREVLINAIQHGNRFDHNKQVRLRLAKNGGTLTVEVNDEGSGFSLRDVPDPRAGKNRERRSGRGLALAAGIMDELVVEDHAQRGALIRMVKRFGGET